MIVTRSSVPVREVAMAVQNALADVSPSQRVAESVDLRARAVQGMARERMLAWISGFFGLLALGLAAIGLYGVVSCVVEGRRGEIGIRMALGAGRWSVAWMVVRQVTLLVVAGLTLGTLLVLGFSDAARPLLIDLEPTDPLTLAASAGLLLFVGLWSALVPVRRASRIDPRSALSE
jgi:ABC-type antimicrobial peptide transport system permease subunit